MPEVVAENNDADIELDPNGPSEGLNANASDADTADLDAAEDALADLSIPETVDEPAVQPEVPEEKPIVEEKATEPEPITEEQPAAEEKPAMPDLSDPNKTLSPDEIAALFANMSDNAPKEEEKPVEAEPIVEEVPQEQPATEEKPPMPDLSDPNKTLSPDEIAALFANMQ